MSTYEQAAVRIIDWAGLVSIVVPPVVLMGVCRHSGWRWAPGWFQTLWVGSCDPRCRLASLHLCQHRLQLFLNFYRINRQIVLFSLTWRRIERHNRFKMAKRKSQIILKSATLLPLSRRPASIPVFCNELFKNLRSLLFDSGSKMISLSCSNLLLK